MSKQAFYKQGMRSMAIAMLVSIPSSIFASQDGLVSPNYTTGTSRMQVIVPERIEVNAAQAPSAELMVSTNCPALVIEKQIIQTGDDRRATVIVFLPRV